MPRKGNITRRDVLPDPVYNSKLVTKLINKIKPHTRNVIELGIFIFLCIDCIVTIWAIQTYQNRVLYNSSFKADSNNFILKIRENIENNYFTNEKMSLTFPNLRVKNENGEEVWIKTLINK